MLPVLATTTLWSPFFPTPIVVRERKTFSQPPRGFPRQYPLTVNRELMTRLSSGIPCPILLKATCVSFLRRNRPLHRRGRGARRHSIESGRLEVALREYPHESQTRVH